MAPFTPFYAFIYYNFNINGYFKMAAFLITEITLRTFLIGYVNR